MTHDQQVLDRLARIETKLDRLVGLPERVESLEVTRGYLKGGLKVLAFLISSAITIYVKIAHAK